MLKLLFILSLLPVPGFAAQYRLDDPAILGEYALEKPDKKSDVQKAVVRFNADNDLIVDFKGDGEGFVMTGPKRGGVVVDFQDEPNCDGDEEACYYDSQITIRLQETEKSGVRIPQLIIEVTSMNAFDDQDQGETTTYVLNWKREIKNGVAYFLNVKNPRDLTTIYNRCKKEIEKTIGSGVHNLARICSNPKTVKFREPADEAVQAYIDEWDTKGEGRFLTPAKLKQLVFDKSLRDLEKIDESELKIPKAEVIAQAQAIYDWITTNSTRIHYHDFASIAVLQVINDDKKLITTFMIYTK